MKTKMFLPAVMIFLCMVLMHVPVEAARNWVYVYTAKNGTDVYYDSSSVYIDKAKKTFSVEASFVFSSSEKQRIIKWAKDRGYYNPEYEKLSHEIDMLFFNYDLAKGECWWWDLYTSEGKFIDGDDVFEESEAITPDTYDYYIYYKVKSDFKI